MICRLRLHLTYTLEEVLFLTMDRALAEDAWLIENDVIQRAFGGLRRSSPAYIEMETNRLMEMVPR